MRRKKPTECCSMQLKFQQKIDPQKASSSKGFFFYLALTIVPILVFFVEKVELFTSIDFTLKLLVLN